MIEVVRVGLPDCVLYALKVNISDGDEVARVEGLALLAVDTNEGVA